MIVRARLTPIDLEPDDAGKPTKLPGQCATCTRCGHTAEDTDHRLSLARRGAIGKLHQGCPNGEHNRYVAQVVPEGVRVAWLHVDGKLYPLDVTGRIVHGAVGVVPKSCNIIVISVTVEHDLTALDFGEKLAAWWYTNVRVRSAAGGEVVIKNRVRKPRKKKEKAKR